MSPARGFVGCRRPHCMCISSWQEAAVVKTGSTPCTPQPHTLGIRGVDAKPDDPRCVIACRSDTAMQLAYWLAWTNLPICALTALIIPAYMFSRECICIILHQSSAQPCLQVQPEAPAPAGTAAVAAAMCKHSSCSSQSRVSADNCPLTDKAHCVLTGPLATAAAGP